MQNEDTQEVQLENQDQTVVAEETTVETTQEAEGQSPEADDSVEARLAKAEAEAAKYRRLFEKSQKPKVETPKAPQSVSPQNNVEETVLLANGMSDELLGELKAVARARGISSLIKAQADPIFVAVKEKFEAEKRQKAASLPASRGAGQPKVQKDFKSPGLSSEEHKRMFKEQFSS